MCQCARCETIPLFRDLILLFPGMLNLECRQVASHNPGLGLLRATDPPPRSFFGNSLLLSARTESLHHSQQKALAKTRLRWPQGQSVSTCRQSRRPYRSLDAGRFSEGTRGQFSPISHEASSKVNSVDWCPFPAIRAHVNMSQVCAPVHVPQA